MFTLLLYPPLPLLRAQNGCLSVRVAHSSAGRLMSECREESSAPAPIAFLLSLLLSIHLSLSLPLPLSPLFCAVSLSCRCMVSTVSGEQILCQWQNTHYSNIAQEISHNNNKKSKRLQILSTNTFKTIETAHVSIFTPVHS